MANMGRSEEKGKDKKSGNILITVLIVIILALFFSPVNDDSSDSESALYIGDETPVSSGYEKPDSHALSEAAVAPVTLSNSNSGSNSAPAAPFSVIVAPEAATTLNETPYISASGVYITISMSDFDVGKGSLVLINSDNRYDIPDAGELSVVANVKTPSYRVDGNDLRLSPSIIEPLNSMMDAFCAETGVDAVAISSAYRDYSRQQEIMNEYVAVVGSAEATKWAAYPGYSEHHSGLAFDFGVYSSGEYVAFSGTGIYRWFSQTSWKYGFILRYPNGKTDKTGIAYEPWHFRYVGEPHAYIIYINDWCLEEYIEMIASHGPDDPYVIEYMGFVYEVYTARDEVIRIPAGCDYEISGNNIDGYIVTVKHEQ